MSNKEKTKEIQTLIELGKEKGYLTYAEVNDALPEDFNSADQLDGVLSMFDELDIEIVDSEDDGKTLKKSAEDSKDEAGTSEKEESEEITSEAQLEAYSKTTDPVRLYLRKMGTVALLTREGEVEIAKKIEHYEDLVLNILLTSPIGIKEVLNLGESLK